MDAANDDGRIIVISSDEEDTHGISDVENRSICKRKNSGGSSSEVEVLETITAAHTDVNVAEAPVSEDCDIEVVQTRGALNLSHIRAHCQEYPFENASLEMRQQKCGKCYCFVCDKLADECESWRVHCNATDRGPDREYWKTLRRQARLKRQNETIPMVPAPSHIGSTSNQTTHILPTRSGQMACLTQSEVRDVEIYPGLRAPSGMSQSQFDAWYAARFNDTRPSRNMVDLYRQRCAALPTLGTQTNSMRPPSCHCGTCQAVKAFATSRRDIIKRLNASSKPHILPILMELNVLGVAHIHWTRERNLIKLAKVPNCTLGTGCHFLGGTAPTSQMTQGLPLPSQSQISTQEHDVPLAPGSTGSKTGRRQCQKCGWWSCPNPKGTCCEICGRVWHSRAVRSLSDAKRKRTESLWRRHRMQRSSDSAVPQILTLEFFYTFRPRDPKAMDEYLVNWMIFGDEPTWKAWNEQEESLDFFHVGMGGHPEPAELLELMSPSNVDCVTKDCIQFENQETGDKVLNLLKEAQIHDEARCFDVYCTAELGDQCVSGKRRLILELQLREPSSKGEKTERHDFCSLILNHHRMVIDTALPQGPANCNRLTPSNPETQWAGYSSLDLSLKGMLFSYAVEKKRCLSARRPHVADWRASPSKGLLQALENLGHSEEQVEGRLEVLTQPQRQALSFMISQESLPGGASSHVWNKNALSSVIGREFSSSQEKPSGDLSSQVDAATLRVRPGTMTPTYFSPVLNTFSRTPPITNHWGGFLCDAPGLGKKVSLLAFIFKTRPRRNTHAALWGHHQNMCRLKATLIICNLQRMHEFFKALHLFGYPSLLNVSVYESSRNSPEDYMLADVVFLDKDSLEAFSSPYRHPLSFMQWWRVVLYDSDYLSYPTARGWSKQVHSFQACRRWCVTSRPFQHGVGPFPKQLEWVRFFRDDQRHSWEYLFGQQYFRLHQGSSLVGARVPHLLYFLRRILFRRSMEQQIQVMGQMKPLGTSYQRFRCRTTQVAEGSESSLDALQNLQNAVREECHRIAKKSTELTEPSLQQSSLDLIVLLLRGAAVGKVLLPASVKVLTEGLENSQENGDRDKECPVCLELMVEKAVLPCQHAFCRHCIQQISMDQQPCPTCRGQFQLEEVQMLIPPRTDLLQSIEKVKNAMVCSQEVHCLNKAKTLLKELDLLWSEMSPLRCLVLAIFEDTVAYIQSLLATWKKGILQRLEDSKRIPAELVRQLQIDVVCKSFEKDAQEIQQMIRTESIDQIFMLDPVNIGPACQDLLENKKSMHLTSILTNSLFDEACYAHFPWSFKFFQKHSYSGSMIGAGHLSIQPVDHREMLQNILNASLS